MSRNYTTSPTMFKSGYPTMDEGIVQPDARLIKCLHQALDAIHNDNHALMIDHIVSDLLKFHQPAYQSHNMMAITELHEGEL